MHYSPCTVTRTRVLKLIQVWQQSCAQFAVCWDMKGRQAWCLDWAKHADMAHACRAPMSFFHTTPLGRIINRLTKDTVDADKNLADFAALLPAQHAPVSVHRGPHWHCDALGAAGAAAYHAALLLPLRLLPGAQLPHTAPSNSLGSREQMRGL